MDFSLKMQIFAEKVEKSGFIFIGPSASVIRTMGDKVAAIASMIKAGVPTVPGSNGPLNSNSNRSKKIGAKVGLSRNHKSGCRWGWKRYAGCTQ